MPTRFAALGIVLVSFGAHAEVIDISWTPDGRFGFEALLDAGQFHEVCGDLAQGDTVQWEFQASVPVDFDIHYHQGEDVVYPVRQSGVSALSDSLAVAAAQTYCWMMSNSGQNPSVINLDLERAMDGGS